MDSFYEKARKTKEQLNAVSPSFCLAKWLHVTLHLPTGRTHSCYHPPSHKIPLAEIAKNPSALHNTQYKMEQRKAMLEGKRPAECSYCWKVEDMKGEHLSDRHYRSAEDWAYSELETIAKMPWDADVAPRYLEVNFNQACQLKCSYCSPQLSSAWMAEIRQMGPYPTRFGHNRLDWFEKNDLIPYGPAEQNPYVDAFWAWWPKVYPELHVFRMTGGEPLIDPNTFRVLEYALENPNEKLVMSITSNMCPPDSQFQRFHKLTDQLIKKKSIKNFFLYASIDSVGKQSEYIRFGLDYKKFQDNVRKFLSIEGTEISFILTFNNLCISGFKDYLKWILDLRREYSQVKQRIHFDTPFLRSPKFLSLQILTPDMKAKLDEVLDWAEAEYQKAPESNLGFAAMEIAKIKRVIEWTKEDLDPELLKFLRADFYKYFEEYDKRRGLNFINTFPEYRDFWNLCKESAKHVISYAPRQNR